MGPSEGETDSSFSEYQLEGREELNAPLTNTQREDSVGRQNEGTR